MLSFLLLSHENSSVVGRVKRQIFTAFVSSFFFPSLSNVLRVQKARSVLTANSTFAHLMHKLGFHNLDDPVKPAGDAYETILAVFHGESGPDDFEEYMRSFFAPLIDTVGDTYRRLR